MLNAQLHAPNVGKREGLLRFQAAIAKGKINLYVLGVGSLSDTLSYCEALLLVGAKDEEIEKFVAEHGQKETPIQQ